MSKSAIDAEVNNQIFRKDWAAIIASRRDLATIAPVRLAYDAGGYLAGQVLARVTSTGVFGKYSAVSGSANDSVCVLFENVTASDEDSALTGGALARAIMGAGGGVYKSKLLDYPGATAMGGKEITDATGITVVKF
jgi:hypothetical protein